MNYPKLHVLAYDLMFRHLGEVLNKMREDVPCMNTSAPVFDQWREYCIVRLQHNQQHGFDIHNPLMDFLNMSLDVRERVSGGLSHKEHEIQKFDLTDQELGLLLKNINIEGTLLYLDLLGADDNHSKRTQNPYWNMLKKHNLLLDPTHPKIPHIWQRVVNSGYTQAAQFLIANNCPPNWSGAHNNSSSEKYDKQDNFLAMITNNQRFKTLSVIPDQYILPMIAHKNSKGEQPIHHAARHLLPNYIEYLIERGAKINVTNNKGMYPFDMIKRTKTRNTHLDDVIDLVGEYSNKDADTLLKQACQSLNAKMAQMAVDRGADLGVLDATDVFDVVFHTPAQARWSVTRTKQAHMAQWLVEQSYTNNHTGESILERAIKNGAVDAVDVILGHNPSLATAVNADGLRPSQLYTCETNTFIDAWVKKDAQEEGLAVTQMEMFHCYEKHNITIIPEDFPCVAHNSELQAHKDKYILQQALSGARNKDNKQRKM